MNNFFELYNFEETEEQQQPQQQQQQQHGESLYDDQGEENNLVGLGVVIAVGFLFLLNICLCVTRILRGDIPNADNTNTTPLRRRSTTTILTITITITINCVK